MELLLKKMDEDNKILRSIFNKKSYSKDDLDRILVEENEEVF